MVLTASLMFAGQAAAVHDLGLFELDRNALDPGGAAPPDDWATLSGGGGNAAQFTGILPDIGADGGTQFHGGGSKDNNNISQWLWEPGEPLDKDDITNAYAAAYTYTGPDVCPGTNCPKTGDTIIYYGLDRFANNGSAQVGFWFFQNQIGLTNTPQSGGFLFSGVHAVGDLLVQSNFTQGGVISGISVFKWVGSGGSNGALDLVFSAADCLGPPILAAGDPACATVNQATTTAPWPYTPKFPDPAAPTAFPTGSFFEGGLDITRLVPDADCLSTFLAETRSSTPFDSRLKDFALGNFNLCSIEVTKTGDTVSKVGDDVNYTVTIHNTGVVTLYKKDITDTLLGAIATNGSNVLNAYVLTNTCGSSLAGDDGAAGGPDECTITLRRTVQAGDSDPLPNTVTVVYNSRSDFTGKAVTDSDGHSVDLVHPGVDVEKTGDAFSKTGDTINYTITIHNTGDVALTKDSISDPNATFTAPPACDSLEANDGAAGGPDECSFSATHVVTATEGAGTTFTNTVTVHYHPSVGGLTNDITDTDSFDTTLVHPGLTVAKTCAPTSATVGQTITFNCTITNTGDVQLTRLSIMDRMVDGATPTPNVVRDLDLTSANAAITSNTCGATLAPTGSCFITYTFTIATQPVGNTLTNTVTASYQVQGLPNVLTQSATCTVTVVPGEGCTPGFWKNHTSRWDQTSDPVVQNIITAINSLGSPYFYDTAIDGLTNQLFRNIFGLTSAQMTAAGLDPNLTMLQAINLGGGGFQKLARHGVAGLLSSAAVSYPFSPTQVLQMVHNAIATLTPEPTATQLANANNLTCPLS